MIKLTLKFIGGFLIGTILVFIITYAFGYIMESMNIGLFDSERDQQRNFNIFIGFTIIIAIISGYLATKFGNKN